MVPAEHVLALSIALFAIGLIGAVSRRNLIGILMSLELMLAASSVALVGFDRLWSAASAAAPVERAARGVGPVPMDGQAFAFLIGIVALSQLAVGLVILLSLVRNRDSMNVEDVSLLRW